MTRLGHFMLLINSILLVSYMNIFPCTGVSARTSTGILVGSNEDYNRTYTDIIARIRPARAGKYGYLATGFARHSYFMMALNERGLFLDMFTVPRCFTWRREPNKLDYNGALEQKIIETCANVEQAVDLLQRYNNPSMGSYPYQIYVVDSSGNSAVICWANGGIEVVRKQGSYQVVTNFFLLHPDCGFYPCWRYNKATEMLLNAREFSFLLFRDLLQQVNLSSNYSQVSNLGKREVAIFNLHNFDEFVTMSLETELDKGQQDISLPNYFSQIKLLAPEDKSILPASKHITIKWQGDTDSHYQFYHATDPDFVHRTPIKVSGSPPRTAKIRFNAILFLGLAFIPIFLKYGIKKNQSRLIILAIVLGALVSCQEPEINKIKFNTSDQTFSVTLTDLRPNVIYYWKVIAFKSPQIQSESVVRAFRTVN